MNHKPMSMWECARNLLEMNRGRGGRGMVSSREKEVEISMFDRGDICVINILAMRAILAQKSFHEQLH